jgi:hypothetical protein
VAHIEEFECWLETATGTEARFELMKVVHDLPVLPVSGIPIFGGFDNKTSGEVIPGAPTLKIRGMVLFGGVDIKPAKRRRR